MITKDNFRSVLDALGFTRNDATDIYYRDYKTGNTVAASMAVDFAKNELNYDSKIKAGRDTTKDFHQNENFVVFECVCRLLERGYSPQNIELEATSGVTGRGQTQTFLDVLIRNNDGKNYLIIECKTAGSEYENAWNKVKHNGGQLFNYWTLFGTKHLCLYASDFNETTKKINYVSNIIIFEKENEIQNEEERNTKLTFLEENNLQGYKDLSEEANQNDYFTIWSETYKQPEILHGIFEEDCQPYEISQKITHKYSDLKEMEDYEEIQHKYHEFATIMRQHNVGSRENSFDKLVNLFLAKIVDETDNKSELHFNWKGLAFDDYYNFQDRLQEMYSIGMQKFLCEKVEYIKDDDINTAFEFFKDSKEFSKDTILELFHKQKFYTNNDFSFLDVHNEKLFKKNIAILIKVVEMLQGMRLKTQTENQFLGDLFEGFLDQGVKQSEGQFFTPTPIVKFLINSLPLEEMVKNNAEPPKVIDYACGAGHFLNEIARRISFHAKKYHGQTDLSEYYANIVGIEKEYRLSKVAKVSAFMYSQDDIKIVYGDALSKNQLAENGTFDILTANPPYSVKGFLETLHEEQRAEYELYTSNKKSFNIVSNNSIETFFVERASQLLKAGGVAAIILPSSILSNGNIYTDCRKLILRNFDLVAIAEFGNGTFGKTGTNTVTLFMRRKNIVVGKTGISIHYKNRVECWFKGDFDKDSIFKDENLLSAYCNHCNFSKDEYTTWLNGGEYPKSEMFTEYQKEFNDSATVKNITKKKLTAKYTQNDKDKEIKEKIHELIQQIEKEKLYYFILSFTNPQKVLIAKSPADSKEVKNYLGYEWSGAKGSEGIKYLGQKTSDDDLVAATKGIMGINTPLFNPNNYDDSTKINFAIKQNFLNGSATSDSANANVSYECLADMIDFNRTTFDCAIKTNVQKKSVDVKYKDGIKIVKLGEVVSEIETGSRPSGGVGDLKEGVLSLGGEHIDNKNGCLNLSSPKYVSKDFFSSACHGKIKQNDILLCKDGALTGKIAIVRSELCNTDAMINEHIYILRCKKLREQIYFFNFLFSEFGQNMLKENITGSAQGGLNRINLKEILIPFPPPEVQDRIVAECTKIDDEAAAAKAKIAELKNNIDSIMSNSNSASYKNVQLSSICDMKAGKFVSADNIFDEQKDGYVPCYGGNGFRGYVKEPTHSGEYTLVGRQGALCGNVCFVSGIFHATEHAVVVTPNNNIDKKWLYHQLKFMNLNQYSTGTAQPGLSVQKTLTVKCPLPPLAEQKKIVEQVEKLEAEIAEAQTICNSAATKKQAILEKYLMK